MAVGCDTRDWKRVLIDVCTQFDFLAEGAILQVANRDTLIGHLRQVFDWAEARRVPIVSAVESHRPTEPSNGFPMHCIDGTRGQDKPPFSLLRPWIMVETDNYLCLPPDLRKNYRQLLFRKRTRDVLSNPKADNFLTQLKADDFILFGVGIERAIKSLALGLLSRYKHVTVITDACGYWSAADAELAIRQLGAKHVRLVTTAEITAPEPAPRRLARRRRRFRYHHTAANVGRHAPSRGNVTKP